MEHSKHREKKGDLVTHSWQKKISKIIVLQKMYPGSKESMDI